MLASMIKKAIVGDPPTHWMPVNVPDNMDRAIGMAVVVELIGLNEESIKEYVIVGDFPPAVGFRATSENAGGCPP